MRNISVFGTSSDAGKSTISLALCLILKERGYSVAPFKAQNMSNNACVTDDGGEIGVAQYIQAEALGIATSYHFNPILLKPQKDNESQVIIKGKAVGAQDAREYFKNIENLKLVVKEALLYLNECCDVVVCEGAGSPVELNLAQKDLSNVFTASEFGNKIILVADIERGGVFASIYGTYALLPENLKKNVIGVVVNKFRGDITLFDEGRRIIEEEFGIPVLGVVPHIPFALGYEDALSIDGYAKNRGDIKVAIIKYPHIANFTDFEPLIADKELCVEFVDSYLPLSVYDMVILPGTKATINDLRWLKSSGLYGELQRFGGLKAGVCGGYQMMFKNLIDEHGAENQPGEKEEGFGWIDSDVVFEKNKTLFKGSYEYCGQNIEGYEIHCGKSEEHPLFFEDEKIFGTHIHGLLHNDSFRTRFLRRIRADYRGYDYGEYRKQELERLKNSVAQSIDVDKIIEAISC